MKKLLLLLVVLCAPAFAQLNWFPNLGAGAPSNPCGNQQIYINTSNGDLYTCTSAAWVKTGTGGGAGTVTSVTFTGDGTVLSSTPSSAVTASGTVTAALANAGANTVLGNGTSGSATPTYLTLLPASVLPAATTSVLGAVIPGAQLSVDGSGNLTWNVADSTVAFYKDEFGTGTAVQGGSSIGELGWTLTQTVACTGTNTAGASPNFGIHKSATGAVAGDGCALALNLGAAGTLGTLGAYSNVEQHYIFKMAQTTDSSFRIGYVIGSAATTVEGTDGVWLRYEKNSSSAGTTQVAGTVVGNGTTAVYTTPTNHGYHVGDSAVTTLCSNAGFNATAAITAVTATTFSTLNATNASATTCTSKVADTTFKFETRKSSTSDSYDTGQTPNTSNFYHLKVRNIASGKVGLTLYDNTGAVLVNEVTFCPSSCTVTSSNVNTASAMVPALIIFSATGGGGAAVNAQIDWYAFKATGLAR